MAIDLTTTYLGYTLRSPLVVSANPLSENLDNIRRMEDAGAGAVVLFSLFEEQLRQEEVALHHYMEQGSESYAEAQTYIPEPIHYHLGSDAYLEHIRNAKQAVDIPIIASLNGASVGGWVSFAKKIEQAGADALELNLYSIPTDPLQFSEHIEASYLETVEAIKKAIKIPVAVKLSPFFTNIASMAWRFELVGVGGLVLFNRFYQPDIDLESRDVYPHVVLSSATDLRLPLRWIAILYKRINVDLAATSGIRRGQDAIKAVMAGANVAMMASILLQHGIAELGNIEREMRQWMEENEYTSVEQMRGCVSQIHCENPSEFERAQYMRALTTYLPPQYRGAR